MTNLCLLAGGIAGWWASIEDAMAEAGVNTIIGISVVFAALLLFVFVISLFKYIYISLREIMDLRPIHFLLIVLLLLVNKKYEKMLKSVTMSLVSVLLQRGVN